MTDGIASCTRSFSRVLLLTLLLPVTALTNEVDFDPDGPAPGNLRFAWIHGSISAMHNTDPRIQVHRYNEHTYILRQNPAVHWEAPFLYLLLGTERALLIDAGATEEADYFPLRQVIDGLLDRWTSANDRSLKELLIITTSDAPAQTAGLGQFADRPGTRILSPKPGQVPLGEAIATDRSSRPIRGRLDLGGRILQLLATPGTSRTGLSLYDPYTDILFTGTALMPGRIVIRDHGAYLDSLERLLALSQAVPLRWILGAQIDMSKNPGVDYRLRSNYRPNERSLQLTPEHLVDAYAVTRLINGQTRTEILADMIIMNGVGRGHRPYGYPVYTPDFQLQRRLR